MDLGAVIGPQVLGDRVTERLRGLASAGYREVEAGIDFLAKHRSELADAGLVPRSAFVPTPAVTNNWSVWHEFRALRRQPPFAESYTFDAVLTDAARLPSVTNLTIVAFAPGERRTLDDFRRRADEVNRAAERCQAAGLTLAYHTHSFEFARIDGQVPMQLLLQEFDPTVRLEVDVAWTALAGVDPAQFIRTHGSRVVAVHLKDRASDAPAVYMGDNWEVIKQGGIVPVGDGTIDFSTVIAAIDEARVRYRFVEDESLEGRYEGLLKSRAFLQRLAG